jgi:hypothetical protein
MTFILSLLGGAWGLIKRLFDIAARYPWQAALIAALCLAGWLYMGKAGAIATVAKRDATIAAMIKARKEATAAQIAMNKAVTDKQTDIARKADNAPTDIIDRGARYADSLPTKGGFCKTDSPAKSGVAADSNPASDTAVVLERADFDILVANTARLVKVKAWADELIAEGLAAPVE